MPKLIKFSLLGAFGIAFAASLYLNYATIQYVENLEGQPILLLKNSRNGDVLVKVPYGQAVFRGVCRPELAL